MRTHGWAGELPADEQQARGRILTAARRLMTGGASPSTAEVARAVGVSRQTVYRYYRTTEELLDAAALDAVADLVDQLSAHVDDVARSQRCDHADVLVEVVLWVALRLRDDPVLLRLVTPGRLSRTVQGFTEPAALALGRELLERMPVDWSALGVDGAVRTELVEHLLRVLQTLVVDPGDRTPEQWRAYLGRWLAPAVRAAPRRPLAPFAPSNSDAPRAPRRADTRQRSRPRGGSAPLRPRTLTPPSAPPRRHLSEITAHGQAAPPAPSSSDAPRTPRRADTRQRSPPTRQAHPRPPRTLTPPERPAAQTPVRERRPRGRRPGRRGAVGRQRLSCRTLALDAAECQRPHPHTFGGRPVPTYQYACTACGEQLEAVQAFTDAALTECPACSGRLRKVYSAVGVVFKGSGFYKNDSRAGEKKSGDKAGDKAAAPAASGDSGASSTPAAASTSSSSGSSSSGSGSASSSTSAPAAKSA